MSRTPPAERRPAYRHEWYDRPEHDHTAYRYYDWDCLRRADPEDHYYDWDRPARVDPEDPHDWYDFQPRAHSEYRYDWTDYRARDSYRPSRENYSSRDDHRRRDHGDRRENRRSRSPHDRRNQRGNRPDVDSYSSQRGYRDREREDQYRGGGRGDRRDDRQWGGDRGSARRDARRDDDGGGRRYGGDRRGGDDLFADRRGPPRGGRDDRGPREDNRDRGRDRDDMRQLERQAARKSASPVRKPKEPTPDLTDIVPILEKPRRMTQWDVKPPGYENVTAEQAKLSGMFPLPGAPRVPQMDANRLKEFMAQPGSQANPTALKPSSARQSKRLLVYNLPASATDDTLMDFFNLQLNGLNVTKGADPCISAAISQGNGYALLEFKTPEDATNAMAMDGIKMEADVDMGNGDSNGTAKGLEIKRPKDYIVPTVSDETENTTGLFSSVVPDTQNKLAITNIPTYIEEAQVIELLTSFGQLKNFVLVKDKSTDESRGIAFVEYKDPEPTTKVALEALHGMDLGDAALKVKLASIGIQQVPGEMTVGAMGLIAGTKSTDADNGRVLCLMNMITPEELMDADEADEILEDIKEECVKYGEVVEVKMPRPTGGSRQNNGIGKIYIKYQSPESAAKALGALAGRKFADRTVVVTYFGEEYFDVNAW